jgi:hypothetical protein
MTASRKTSSKSTIEGEATETFAGQVTPDELQGALDRIPADMVVSKTFTDDDLRALTSFEQALALTQQTHGEVVDAANVLGNGFVVLDNRNKAKLVGVPVLLMDWQFNAGNFGRFVSAYLVAKNDDGSIGRWILNDGSKGVAETLAKYTEDTGKSGGLLVQTGLRSSDYTFCSECRGAVDPFEDSDHRAFHGPATTYYLAV